MEGAVRSSSNSTVCFWKQHRRRRECILQISMDTAQAHTDAGQPTITDRDRQLNCRNLKQLVLICDFEAKVGFVFVLDSKKPYRVVELQNPARLVVDVKN